MLSVRSFHRIAAVAEVIAAFVVVHLCFRAIKNFTALGRLDAASGLNFTPGIVMIVFTAGVLLCYGRSFSAYGLSTARWTDGLRLGLLWGLLLVGGAAFLALIRVRHQAGGPPPGMSEGIAYGLSCLAAVFVLARMAGHRWTVLSRVPAWICIAAVASLCCVPLLFAWHYRHPVWHTLLTVMWLVIGAGVGEEVFYRGYIQSRLNEVFGRPFQLWGVQFGVGLLVSSVLFGFLHALNTVDYFHGRFTFAWGFGLAAIGAGLLYGCLRECSGSVVAGVITHSVLDVLARVPTLMTP